MAARRERRSSPPPRDPPPLELVPEQVDHLLEELREYHEVFSPLFFRKEQRKWAYHYLGSSG